MKIYDFVGIGFGPANLSVAVAMEEMGLLADGMDVAFLESKPEFVWHGGMLLPEAEMQISFFKDLATLRNPSSKYTYLNYLAEKNRLESFANLKRFFPRRIEYNDYLKWAAEQFKNYVSYNERVVTVEPYRDSHGPIKLVAIKRENVITGETSTIYARNVSLATGLCKKFPDFVTPSPESKVFHSADFLVTLREKYSCKTEKHEFLVVGSGQSAAEITAHLADNYPNSKVTMCYRGFAIKPADETEFVNEVFSSSTAEEFLQYDGKLREQVLSSHRDTNYSVVDPELISQLYERLYTQKVTGEEQVALKHFHELRAIDETSGTAVFHDIKSKQNRSVKFDAAFLATGYESKAMTYLQGFEDYLQYDESGELLVDENYKVKAQNQNAFLPNMFVQGISEKSHGLSETLLSLLAYRSTKIANQLTVRNQSIAV